MGRYLIFAVLLSAAILALYKASLQKAPYF